MKLIIDIDDEMVCNDIKNKALEPTSETDKVIINALYNGTPVSNEGDLISREALKKAFNKWWGCDDIPATVIEDLIDNAPTVEINTNDIEYKAYCKGLEDGKKIARPQVGWIPVCERLPFNYVLCLFCDKEGNIFYGHRKSNNLWYEEYQNENISDVIVWQPLPEPYQKGGNDND